MSEEARPRPVGRIERALAGLSVVVIVALVGLFGLRVLRINYVETPADRWCPPAEVVGRTTAILPDGAAVTVQTRGYEALGEAERAMRSPVRLRVRGFRPEAPGGQTRLWVNAIDKDGRSVRHLKQSDFEVIEGERPVPRFAFTKATGEEPPSFAPPFIWVANSDEHTVSKLSTRTGEESGRYKVGKNPSRTSVDLDGNVLVASRDSHEVTKIQAVGCQGQACVLWTRPTCIGARGLAVDADNRVWVGGGSLNPLTPELGCLQMLDGDTGALILEHQDLTALVYGLAIDQEGTLWAVQQANNRLVKISRAGRIKAEYRPPEPASLYGLAVDRGGRIWVSNFTLGDVLRFDPGAERWDRFGSPMKPTGRGVAADVAGNVWVASSSPALVSRFEAESGRWVADYDPQGVEPIGIAIDADQLVWVVNQKSDRASKLDPATGEVVGVYPVGRSPYTYSDMTGYALNNFVATRGLYTLSYHKVPFKLRISAPDEGATLAAVGLEPTALRIALERFDPGDPLVRVQWSVDGQGVGVVRASPFTLMWSYKELSEGWHTIKVSGVSAAGFEDEDQIRVRAIRTFGAVRLEVVRGGAVVSSLPRAIELVIDSSGSMWGAVDGQRKIDVAKAAVVGLLDALPEGTTVALRAYGHRSNKCTDTELLVGPGPRDRAALKEATLGLKPRGRTPIAHALEAAAADLSAIRDEGLGERVIVLVTDGIETCQGDPCAVARRLGGGPVGLRANVIGFGLDAGVDRASLKCVAEETGGIYADAADARALERELERAIRLTWDIVDASGAVAQVGTLEEPRAVLPVGRYRVRLGSRPGGRVLESALFDLPSGAEVIVRVNLDGPGPPAVEVLGAPAAP